MILIDAPTPELRVSLSLIIPVVLALSAILLFLVRLAVHLAAPAVGDRRVGHDRRRRRRR